MSQAILKYDIPEEASEYYEAYNGNKAFATLRGLDNWLRNLSKYQDQKTISIEKVRNKIHSIATSNYINIFE